MKHFINPQKENFHKTVINNFSENNKFISSGLVRSSSENKYTWIADYLFKIRNNFTTNNHLCSISFFSNKEIMISNFGNITELQNKFEFLKTYEREKYSPYTYELSSNQYKIVGQEYTEFDLIEYINASDKVFSYSDTPTNGINIVINKGEINENAISINHSYNDSPIFHAEGYKVYNYPSAKNTYLWSNEADEVGFNLNNLKIDLNDKQQDLTSHDIIREACASAPVLYNGPITYYVSSTYVYIEDPSIDPEEFRYKYAKITYNDGTYTYFYISSSEWGVPFTVEIQSPTGVFVNSSPLPNITVYDLNIERVVDYKIQVDHKNFFYFNEDAEWVVYHSLSGSSYVKDYYPTTGFVVCYDQNDNEIHPDNIMYMPQTISQGAYEPAKIIIKWAYKQAGKCCFNPGYPLDEKGDQSRLIYRICRRMFTQVGDKFIIKTPYYGEGIDFEKERNKRSTAIVTTDPYMITTPISNGKLINYKFIDDNGNNITNDNEWNRTKPLYLKIKSDKSVLNEIKSLLNSDNKNTDIYNVLHISDPSASFKSGSGYNNFYNGLESYYNRQNIYLNDYRLSGDGYGYFYIPIGSEYSSFINFDKDNYFDGTNYRIKIDSMGSYNDSDGNPITTIYCHNVYKDEDGYSTYYTPFNYNNPDLFNNTIRIDKNEIVTPMLKLDKMNGYIKILKEKNGVVTTKTNDGFYEMTYIVEFPYSIGSTDTRLDFNFVDYEKTQILMMNSYINCGSDPSEKNIRNRFSCNDSFTTYDVVEKNGNIVTYRKDNGGGIYDLISSSKNKIEYPKQLTYNKIIPNLISSTSNSTTDYLEKYQVEFISTVNEDIEFSVLIDNRKWRFDKDRHESYISRENPAYIFSIDVSTLYNDYTKYQKENACIPDMKRWVHAYVKGFGYTMLSDGFHLASSISQSDLVIDIWDNASLISTNNRSGNWRKISPDIYEDNQIPGELLYETAMVVGSTSEVGGSSTTNLWKITFNALTTYVPESLKTGNITNMMLYNETRNLYGRIVRTYYSGSTLEIFMRTSVIGVGDKIKVYKPVRYINKYKPFMIDSGETYGDILTDSSFSFLKKYLDIRHVGTDLEYTDYKRYVDSDNRVFFRFRLNNSGKYSSKTTENIDIDEFQISTDDSNINTGKIDGGGISLDLTFNNPWELSDIFNWEYIKNNEKTYKIGLDYFRLQSK